MKTANDYPGRTDSDRLEAAVAAGAGGIVVIPQRCCDTEPERRYWCIDRAILLPENTTVILQNCKIKLSDQCRDNFFRSANCGLGVTDIRPMKNIHIRGEGNCVLEGADRPRATGDSSKQLKNPCPKNPEDVLRLAHWIPPERRAPDKLSFWDIHDYSCGTDAGKETESQWGDWRGIGILLACVEHFSIENLRIVDPHGWGISLENCAHGSVRCVDFEACMARQIDGLIQNSENQDGIDLRNGCHDIQICDITGTTGDDIVALTAVADTKAPFQPSGSLRSTHVMHNDWTRRDPDIHDVIIRNVSGWAKGGCNLIRLLPAGGNIYNVIIDGVIDTEPEGFLEQALEDKMYPNALLLGDGGFYGENLRDGMRCITVSNVISRSARAVCVAGYLSDAAISNVINRNPDGSVIFVERPDGMKNVHTSNLVTVGTKPPIQYRGA